MKKEVITLEDVVNRNRKRVEEVEQRVKRIELGMRVTGKVMRYGFFGPGQGKNNK